MVQSMQLMKVKCRAYQCVGLVFRVRKLGQTHWHVRQAFWIYQWFSWSGGSVEKTTRCCVGSKLVCSMNRCLRMMHCSGKRDWTESTLSLMCGLMFSDAGSIWRGSSQAVPTSNTCYQMRHNDSRVSAPSSWLWWRKWPSRHLWWTCSISLASRRALRDWQTCWVRSRKPSESTWREKGPPFHGQYHFVVIRWWR